MATKEILKTKTDWFVDIDKKVKEMKEKEASSSLSENERRIWTKHSIFRVQPHIQQMNKAAYTPQVVSFGPYHHCHPRVKKMEEHKERVLLHVLKRQNKSIRDYEKALKEEVQLLMDCYADLDRRWRLDPEGFLKLMIVDGCFLLEILKTSDGGFSADYANNDPIFSRYGMLRNKAAIKRDMILVENQLPLPLLHKLLAVEGPIPDMEKYLCNLIRNFIGPIVTEATRNKNRIQKLKCLCNLMRKFIGFTVNEGNAVCSGTPADTNTEGGNPPVLNVVRKRLIHSPSTSAPTNTKDEKTQKAGLVLHVLDVVWKSLIKSCHSQSTSAPTAGADTEVKIPYATQLREAGIRFRPNESSSLRDITFSSSTLTLPVLVIDDYIESTLLNLMAFERLHMEVESHVSSFVCFMDDMIDTEEDVRLLHSEGVVVNVLGSDRDAAELLNRMAKGAIVDPPHSLLQVGKNATEHCNKKCNKWRANFKHTYLSNPWVFTSLLAAIFLLALTVLQTIYTILPFYNH